jgi:hypothetical protein
MGVDGSSKVLNFAVSGLDFGDQFHDGVVMRLCFGLRGIARGPIGPGTVITDSTPKAFLAAPRRPSSNCRNRIPHCSTAHRPIERIADECSD